MKYVEEFRDPALAKTLSRAIAAAVQKITTEDPRFAVESAEIRGVTYRVFKNAPGSLRAMMQGAAAMHDDGDFLVYQNERMSYPDFCDRTNRLAHAMARELGVGRR